MLYPKPFLSCLLLLAGTIGASAHLSYIGRDYGTFTGGSIQSKTISGQLVESVYGWADGSDADFAASHYQSFFKFTLQKTATITLTVTSLDPVNLLPAYSIYSGLGHAAPPDNDEDNVVTQDYLAGLPGPPKEGAFDALHTWRMGNENAASVADLSVFTYMGHVADGTSANFGLAAGILGDGVADGFVSGSFTLPAGSYTVAIGGANYFNRNDSNYYGFTTSMTVVPEPSGAFLFLGGLCTLALCGPRRRAGLMKQRHSMCSQPD